MLGWTPTVAISPYPTFAAGQDPDFRTAAWAPERQLRAARHGPDGLDGPRSWERPAVGFAPVTGPAMAAELSSIFRHTGTEIVHAHHPHQSARPAMAAARGLGLPFVFELRCFNGDYNLDTGAPRDRLRGHRVNALEMRTAREADAVVTIADGLAERLAAGGVPEARIHVVRNAVDTTSFHPGAVPRRQRPPGEPVHIGYATTFARMENLDGFLRAMRVLLDRRPDLAGGLRATLAGDGPEMERLLALRRALGLEDVVDLPGFVPYSRMPTFLGDLDLFVVTRGPAAVARLTTPLKPLEALAVGVPVLSTDLPAMQELLGGRADVRFTPPTPEGLADGIEGFVDAPWSGTGEIGDRSWHREVLRYPAIYDAARTAARPVAGAHRRWRPRWPAPKVHAVICGFPRSGSTLFQLMLEACVDGLTGSGEERPALDAIAAPPRGARHLVTKLPDDVLYLDAIREAATARGTRPVFFVMVRDPLDCLTSMHKAYPATRGYYVSIDRWLRLHDAVTAARGGDDVILLRYEDMVRAPDEAGAAVPGRLGLPLSRPLGTYLDAAKARPRNSMTEGALGGLRPLETAGIGRGRAPEHAARRAAILAAIPDFADRCAALGYDASGAS